MRIATVKLLASALLTFALMFMVTGCTEEAGYLPHEFTYARIYTPGGELLVEGKVSSWLYIDSSPGTTEVAINGVWYMAGENLLILSSE